MGPDRRLRSPALRRHVGFNDHCAAADGVRSQCCGPVLRRRHADLLRRRGGARAELSPLQLLPHRRPPFPPPPFRARGATPTLPCAPPPPPGPPGVPAPCACCGVVLR